MENREFHLFPKIFGAKLAINASAEGGTVPPAIAKYATRSVSVENDEPPVDKFSKQTIDLRCPRAFSKSKSRRVSPFRASLFNSPKPNPWDDECRLMW
jgi:hypothetical protein